MKQRLAVSALVTLVACGGGAGDDYTVHPPGTNMNPGGNTTPDAAVGGDGTLGSGAVAGRVCLANDTRLLAGCAGVGVGGLAVSVGSAVAITSDDGSFALVPPSTGGDWLVTGGTGSAAVRPSVMPFSSGTTIPAIRADQYSDMIAGTAGAIDAPGTGALMVRTRQAGAALHGVVASSGTATTDAFYDGSNDLAWSDDQTTGTGTFGVVWIPGETDGLGQLSLLAAGSATPETIDNIPIDDGAVTFLSVTIP